MKSFAFKSEDIGRDLGFSHPFHKGEVIPVRNCWHFSTDGSYVDAIFVDEEDFVDGMNRIFVINRNFNVIILAFALMDTHIHFVLYGEWDVCNRFIHEYVRCTSQYFHQKHREAKKMLNVPVNYQTIDNDLYLKRAICYVIKNPVAAGLQYCYYDYPWSSGSLYFRNAKSWCAPKPVFYELGLLPLYKQRALLKSRTYIGEVAMMVDDMIYPGEYVNVNLVERIFKTVRGFDYFMRKTKEEDVESLGGAISHLSIPMQEMRQHKNEMCMERFGVPSIKTLDTRQRIELAKALRSRYNSSLKQVARLCGLVYDEVKDLL